MQTSADGRRHRRSSIIDPAFQWKYTIIVSGSIFFVTMLMSVLQYAALDAQLRARLVNPAASHAWSSTLIMALSALAFSLLMAGAIGFWGVAITQRVAGPLFVLQAHLREIINGRFPTVRRLRKKDEFKELNDTFTEAVDALKRREQGYVDALAEMLLIARSTASADEQQVKRAIDDLTVKIERLHANSAETLGQTVVPPERASQSTTKQEEALAVG
jgi:methyl-accepting chemotaxis protein